MQRGESAELAHAGWPEAWKAILACDPLYATMAIASSQEEAYRLVRRRELDELFKDQANAAKDIVRYADIALDLDVYGFAGILYWNALVSVKPDDYGNRELIEYFLYCLEQLGVKDLKNNFRGEHAAKFAKIKDERRKLFEAFPAVLQRRQTQNAGPEPGKK